jgi:hypothetical protein
LKYCRTKPNVSHTMFFCYTCFVYLSATQRDKLDLKAVKCIFLGYSQTKKDTSIMILSPRNCISLKIYALLKPIHTSRVLIRGETLLEFFFTQYWFWSWQSRCKCFTFYKCLCTNSGLDWKHFTYLSSFNDNLNFTGVV